MAVVVGHYSSFITYLAFHILSLSLSLSLSLFLSRDQAFPSGNGVREKGRERIKKREKKATVWEKREAQVGWAVLAVCGG